jgi:hypothetical protein
LPLFHLLASISATCPFLRSSTFLLCSLHL